MQGMNLAKITLFYLFLLFIIPMKASHIMGGDLSYECLGGDNYRITLHLYLNCNSQSMDDFSDPAPITIYRGEGINAELISNTYVPLASDVEIPPPDDPCLTLPPDICVKEGIYVFDANLPLSTEKYTVVYQRCCRNAAVTNIIQPNRRGASFVIEILPAAQNVCNNSPVFNDFPPIVICSNEPLIFDHSATDPEGDQLVYEMCAPLRGAGVVGAFEPGDPTSCDGFRPDPSCPPPYDDIEFTLPTYSALNPMGGDPQIVIDPNTGIISGTPIVMGQFVVGICVKEFRNGELLSVTTRDFQFNVSFCQPTIRADMVADDEIEGPVKTFIYDLCDDNTLEIENTSIQESSIDAYQWTFDLAGTPFTSALRNPTISFPSIGTYNGQLVLNPGALDCTDTANVIVNVFPGSEADFSFDYDTCVAGPVSFTDLSESSGAITDWMWSFGDGETSDRDSPDHLYEDPGNHEVQLVITDDDGCLDTITNIINWFPAPPLIVIEPSSFIGCEPLDVFFNNLSSPIDDSYIINWTFGDGNTSGAISPNHTYEMAGFYDVSVEITSPLGCFIEESWQNWIEVQPTPTADFTFDPPSLSNFDGLVNFEDQSVGASAWQWDFNGQSSSFQQHPSFEFRDTGMQQITLVVQHPFGCTDTIVKFLDVVPMIRYFLPNAFTPNSDAVNDEFVGAGYFVGLKNFNMQIWNRWGEMIFESFAPEQEWNGRKNNQGEVAPNGVYVYVVNFEGPRGGKHFMKGFVTLIR